jgi:glyoxylase-like metal-dependent hydrolase (beta-lactamase superfamily II)
MGSFSYRRIHCGNIQVDMEDMLDSSLSEIWLTRYPILPDNKIKLSLNSLFLQDANSHILIDPGMNASFTTEENYQIECVESIADQLKDAGSDTGMITDIILSHLHFDHCAGIFHYQDNFPIAPVFPSATLIFSREQYENILMPDESESTSFIHNFLYFAEKYYPIKLIDGKAGRINDCIQFRKYSGHSPGMLVPFIQMDKKPMVFTSDLTPLLANASLNIVSKYDLDPEMSLREMTVFLMEAKKDEWELFLYHEPGDNIVKC